MDLKKIVKDLVESFLIAGDLAIDLRAKGLIKKIKLISNHLQEILKFLCL